MGRNIIRDGYTRRGRIEASERLYDEVTFTYRPMLPSQMSRIDSKIGRAVEAGDGSDIDILAAAVTKQLVEWSEEDENGQIAPVEFDNVRRLPWPVLNAMHKIIAGVVASDPLNEPTKQEKLDAEAEVKAILEGEAPGPAVLEESRKNS